MYLQTFHVFFPPKWRKSGIHAACFFIGLFLHQHQHQHWDQHQHQHQDQHQDQQALRQIKQNLIGCSQLELPFKALIGNTQSRQHGTWSSHGRRIWLKASLHLLVTLHCTVLHLPNNTRNSRWTMKILKTGIRELPYKPLLCLSHYALCVHLSHNI